VVDDGGAGDAAFRRECAASRASEAGTAAAVAEAASKSPVLAAAVRTGARRVNLTRALFPLPTILGPGSDADSVLPSPWSFGAGEN
jgi:hypothetical protein